MSEGEKMDNLFLLTNEEKYQVQMALKSCILEDDEYLKTLDKDDAKEVAKSLETL